MHTRSVMLQLQWALGQLKLTCRTVGKKEWVQREREGEGEGREGRERLKL